MTAGSVHSGELPPLAAEQGIELYANGRKVATLLCTPVDLEDLAWGHLASRGLIGSIRDGVPAVPKPSFAVCDSRGRVDVVSDSIGELEGPSLGAVVASGCGAGAGEAGAEAIASLLFAKASVSGLCVDMATLSRLARDMFSRAEMYRNTGGMHCAAVAIRDAACGAGGWRMIVREDVGRHNAVDKAIGRALLDGLDLSMCIILTSGRIAADMALKACNCGVPILASRSIPTTAAYELAVRGGLTLVGRTGSGDPSVYTHPERIRQEESDVR